MLELGFWLIPLGKHTKRPLANFSWIESSLSNQAAQIHVLNGGNIGVVAGLSNPPLVILDYDSQVEEKETNLRMPASHLKFPQTLVSQSPNGAHFFCRGEYDDKLFQKLKEKYPEFDLCRAGNGYVVVPLSETCLNEHSEHNCKGNHDYRLHSWFKTSEKQTLLSFSDFCTELI